jgi:hypothetical protein
MAEKEEREHGILFGRGDDLGDDVEEPPMGRSKLFPVIGNIPGYGPPPIAFGDPPPEPVELEGEIPWELRDEPPSGPVLH